MTDSLYQCNYVIRKGKMRGNQCLKSAWEGFCNNHTHKLYKRDYRIALLEENSLIDNYYMISKCLQRYNYTPKEIIHFNKDIILLWLKQNNHENFILKNWLISCLLIKDINNIIKSNYYNIEYNMIFEKINY